MDSPPRVSPPPHSPTPPGRFASGSVGLKARGSTGSPASRTSPAAATPIRSPVSMSPPGRSRRSAASRGTSAQPPRTYRRSIPAGRKCRRSGTSSSSLHSSADRSQATGSGGTKKSDSAAWSCPSVYVSSRASCSASASERKLPSGRSNSIRRTTVSGPSSPGRINVRSNATGPPGQSARDAPASSATDARSVASTITLPSKASRPERVASTTPQGAPSASRTSPAGRQAKRNATPAARSASSSALLTCIGVAGPCSGNRRAARSVARRSSSSGDRRSVPHRSSPRYVRGAARNTLAPARLAATAAETACELPPITTTSTRSIMCIMGATSWVGLRIGFRRAGRL